MFKNRQEAGKLLADKLLNYKDTESIIYALPRGGVVLGAEIADKLNLPLDIIITRKIGHPLNPEYAVCAISENGNVVCNEEEAEKIDENWLSRQSEDELKEAGRRRLLYKTKRLSTEGKIAILVDDGIATGLTMLAAINEIREQKPMRIVVAVPVMPRDAESKILNVADESVSLEIPEYFAGAIGSYYEEFGQVSDEEVIELLNKNNEERNHH